MKINFWKNSCVVILVLTMLVTLVSCNAKDESQGNNDYDGYYTTTVSNNLERPSESEDAQEEAPEYGKLIENVWVNTHEQPTSTFSSDVDTASYTRLRALIKDGTNFKSIKNYYGSSIRTEEMLNYFKYSTALPQGNDLFGVKTEIAPCRWNEEAQLLMMTFKAKEVNVENKGNNLVFLIDVSGSMDSKNKLPLLKTAFRTLVNVLNENDRVSIVTYSGSEKVVLSGCPGNEKTKILNAVDSLSAGGSTNGSAGMERAYSIAQDYYIEGGNNRILMATDGDLNVGITSTEGILSYVENKRQSGIYISTLGFGTGGYNDGILETIADNGNGAYYYIDGESEAEKIFGSDLLSTLYTVAEDVKFQITFNPDAVTQYRLVGYENRVMDNEDFENDTKDAGEVGSGQQLVVCYEIKVSENCSSVDDWMSLSVRYKEPGQLESILNEYNITGDSYSVDRSEDMKYASAVIILSMLLHDSEYLDANINLPTVLKILSSVDLNDDYYKEEFVSLVQALIQNG